MGGYRTPKPPRATAHPIAEGPNGMVDMIGSAVNDDQRALAILCGFLGLRVSEARSVRISDFDSDHRTLTVRGKGDKWRTIPVSEYAWGLLESIRLRSESDVLVKLGDRGARKAVTSMGKKAHLSRSVASHDLRMTFGTAAYTRTKDLRTTQELLGHASSKTTENYTGITMDAMRKAVDIL